MRISLIGNLYQPIPAIEYGGIQRCIAQTAIYQAAMCANDITLYASADSTIIDVAEKTSADMGLFTKVNVQKSEILIINSDGRVGYIRLKDCGINAIGYKDPLEDEKHNQLFDVLLKDEKKERYDLIHLHHRWFVNNGIIAKQLTDKTLVHHHTGNVERTYHSFNYPIVCISLAQSEILKKKGNANVFAVVYNGIGKTTYKATTSNAGYLVWIGRFLWEKGAHRAIEIAKKAGKTLILAGVIYEKKHVSEEYFKEQIEPYIDVVDRDLLTRISGMPANEVAKEVAKVSDYRQNLIIYCGAASEIQKQALYGHAEATLFPISWAEPFGLVMIESMACGTPVIAFANLGDIDCGAVREIIHNNKTGFIISPIDEEDAIKRAVQAVNALGKLDRKIVREVFEEHWTSEKIALRQNVVYENFVQSYSECSSLKKPD